MPETLRLRRVAIDTYHENVAYLHRDCLAYRSEGFQALNKLEIHVNGDGPPVLAVLNVVDDPAITARDELGLSEQAFAQLGVAEGTPARIAQAQPPDSLGAVHRKIHGERLDQAEYHAIAQDIVGNRYSKIEMSAFIVACAQTGLERDEVLALTRAMLDSGERLDWGEPLVVDKHCIGGVPGNRTSLIVVPIVAAHGLLCPKTSSRAITSPAGTADTMECLARVTLDPRELRAIAQRERGFLAWGGTARLAPADDVLIAVERPLSLDSPGQMVASILAKKLAAGSTHLIVDIPIGPSAKIRHTRDALRLRKLFEFVGDSLGLTLEVLLTDGRQPIGRGVGPVLEVRDALQVLRNDPQAPADLRAKSLLLAGHLLELDPQVRGGAGQALAEEILVSGRAWAKMEALIDAQGRNREPPTLGALRHEVVADNDGIVCAIDNRQIARIARLAGAPLDPGAGVDLYRRLGEPVRAGDALYAIHAEFPADFRFARAQAARHPGYRIGEPGTTIAEEGVA
ncbi:thymidine phosphorylase family protein [Thioalkalicoccus limnaeus]|uniref:Putative thymidine phosphorylase n=1 Tax=Thioalkalicoccus limnaeus TaxID=120681 RepID=A0ABV4BEY2_9GAMM